MFNILSHQGNTNQNNLRFHLRIIRMAKIQTQEVKDADKDVEKAEHFFISDGTATL
jgi:NAD(P)H-dependent FMN reductase